MDIGKSIILAALLHDIGKVVRRSGYSGEDHSSAGVDFLRKNDFKLPNLNLISEVIKYHHASSLKNSNLNNDHIAYLIYEADNIASAVDRRKYADDNRGNEMSLLSSVFNVLNIEKGKGELKHQYIANLEKEIDLPIDKPVLLSQSEYGDILNRLRNHFMNLDYEKESLDTILNVFENLLRNVPSSSYVDIPDISLYDHLKMTAAISSCLYHYYDETGINDYRKVCYEDNQSQRDKNIFLLVSGDFSGIQDFIYTITSKKAMKSLRGRSLYLELLAEHIIDEILTSLNLCRANLIYSGGGHFYLLLPNTEKVKETLTSSKEKISDWLLRKYNVQLYLERGWAECSSNELGNNLNEDIKNENLIGEVYRRASYEVSKGKIKRYSKNQLKDIFNPDSDVNKINSFERECTVCKKSSSLLDDEQVCEECNSLINLGRMAANIGKSENDYMMIVLDDIPDSNDFYLELPKLDGDVCYLKIVREDNYLSGYKESNEIIRAYLINSLKVGQYLVKNIWVGNYNVPSSDKNSLIEFEELVKKSVGIERLAVLRADIDNLGMTFIRGFEQNSDRGKYQYASLSRTSVLSRKLTEFFKQDINKIAGMKMTDYKYTNFLSGDLIQDKRGRDLTIVYSGGDDMFIIGTWNDVIEFSVDLKKIFDLYTQKKLTFSAGIGIFRKGFPVYQMAKITGNLEEKAKNYPGKNAVTLFPEESKDAADRKAEMLNTFSWDDFINSVIKDKFVKLNCWFGMDDDHRIDIGKSMLYKILRLVRRIIDGDGSIDLARMAYLLGRLNERVDKKDPIQVEKYDELRIKLFEWLTNKSDAKALYLALQLMIYSLREKGDSR